MKEIIKDFDKTFGWQSLVNKIGKNQAVLKLVEYKDPCGVGGYLDSDCEVRPGTIWIDCGNIDLAFAESLVEILKCSDKS